MTKHDHDRDPDRDNRDNHANDNDTPERKETTPGAVAPVPAGGALTSLAALSTVLNKVDTASVIGRSGLPMLQFKREGDGTWSYGQKRTEVEEGSRWAANLLSLRYGYIYFDSANKPHERLVPVTQPKPDLTTLPDTGFPGSEEWVVNLKCIDGADAGTEVEYKTNTDGGTKAIARLVEEVRDRLNSGQHDGKVVPIMQLEKDSYQNAQYGRVWLPVLAIVDWMPLDGPVPAPTPTSPPPSSPPTPPTEQPRRRRVV
jgi:hypothetical protein